MTAGKGLHRTRPGHRVKRPGSEQKLAQLAMAGPLGALRDLHPLPRPRSSWSTSLEIPLVSPRPGSLVTTRNNSHGSCSAAHPNFRGIVEISADRPQIRPVLSGCRCRANNLAPSRPPPPSAPGRDATAPDLPMPLRRAKILGCPSTARGPCDSKLGAGNVQASMSANRSGLGAGVSSNSENSRPKPGSPARHTPLAEDATTA